MVPLQTTWLEAIIWTVIVMAISGNLGLLIAAICNAAACADEAEIEWEVDESVNLNAIYDEVQMMKEEGLST